MLIQDKFLKINAVLQRAKTMPSLAAKYADIGKIENAADLKRVPILTKKELLAAFPDLTAKLMKSPMRAFIVSSGGSTGEPVTVFAPDHFFIEDICRQWRPLERGDIFCNLLSPGRLWIGHNFFNRLGSAFATITLPLGGLGKDEMDTWVPFMIKQKVTTLGANPSNIRLLLEYLKAKNIELPTVKKIIWGGEPFDESLYQLKQETLPQAQLWGLYGSAEVFSIGTNTPDHPLNVFDIHNFQHIEIEDGQILSTNFHPDYPSLALRFEVGDTGEFDETKQQLRLLKRTKDEMGFRNCTFSPTDLIGLLKQLPDIENAQIAISKSSTGKDLIEFHLLPKSGRSIDINRVKAHLLKESFLLGSRLETPDSLMRIFVVSELWRNPRTHKIPAAAPAKQDEQ